MSPSDIGVAAASRLWRKWGRRRSSTGPPIRPVLTPRQRNRRPCRTQGLRQGIALAGHETLASCSHPWGGANDRCRRDRAPLHGHGAGPNVMGGQEEIRWTWKPGEEAGPSGKPREAAGSNAKPNIRTLSSAGPECLDRRRTSRILGLLALNPFRPASGENPGTTCVVSELY